MNFFRKIIALLQNRKLSKLMLLLRCSQLMMVSYSSALDKKHMAVAYALNSYGCNKDILSFPRTAYDNVIITVILCICKCISSELVKRSACMRVSLSGFVAEG